MGRELMHTYPVYTESLLLADDILARHGCEWSLIGKFHLPPLQLVAQCFLEELSKSKESSLLRNAYLAQPSCTAIQMALVNLLDTWNIKPIGVVGHSSGEIAAAYASGAITFETGMLLAYHRGTAAAKLLKDFPAAKGAMLAIGGPQADLDALFKTHSTQDTVKACINSPASVTLSGDESEIDILDKAAKEKSLFSRKLQTDVAYHSHHMLLVADYYRDCVGEIAPGDLSKADFHSSLLGRKLANDDLLETEYWVKNLTSPVLFSDALESLCSLASGPEKHPDVIIEIGPHNALKGPIRDTLNTKLSTSAKPEYLPSLVRFEDSIATMLETAACLLTKGSRLNLSAINFPTKDPRRPTILTDLETYAWDHSKTHWYESRIAQGYRLRRGARNDILGVPAADFNDLEPRWRNVIRCEDLPWLEQHKVQGNMVYPMSGFVSMAIEAMKFRADSRGRGVDRYLMREIHTNRPLIVPADTAVETMVTLRPYNESATISSDKWDEFRILSWTADQGWSEHCRGLVAIEPNNARPKKDMLVAGIRDECISEVKSSGIYDMLSKMGITYGPLFMGIDNLTAGPQHATGTLTIPDTAAAMPYQFESVSVIHPVTLDMCFQFIWPTVIGNSLNLKALYVPSSIKSIAISSQAQGPPGAKLRVFGRQIQTPMVSKRMAASLFVEHNEQGDSEFAIEIESLSLTRISDEPTLERSSRLAYKIEWKPDISFMSSTKIQHLPQSLPPSTKAMEEPLILEQASLVFFRRAINQVPKERLEGMQPHLQKLYHWMKKVCELGRDSSILLQSQEIFPPFTDDVCLEQASQLCSARGELTCLMGHSLPAILRGEADALSLLLRDNLLKEYYSSQDSILRCYQHACQYVDLIAHQNPALRVLEIGAGTGGATLPILETLGGQDGMKPRFLRYDYTDISGGFLDAAKERFKPWSSLLHYRILDIEKELSDQGFDSEEYDLIIAANVLHATSLLLHTMKNVCKLLKPGGRLVLIEETVPALRRFLFATLPGWWLSKSQEPARRRSLIYCRPRK